jgi:hypothetical protein
MRELWRDARGHPVAAGCFLVFWLAPWVAYVYLGWSSGIPTAGMVPGLLAPVVAGALVGWWRAPALESLLVDGRRIAGAPLAAVLVIVTDVTLVFAPDVVRGLGRGAPAALDAIVGWLGASVVLGLIAMLFGWLAGAAGGLLARVLHQPRSA